MKPGSNVLNLIWAVCEKAITIVLTLVCTAVIARYFGLELFGAYQYAMSVLFVATAITWLCPSEVLISRVNQDGSIDSNVVVTSIIYRFLISASVFLATLVFVYIFVDNHQKSVFILILAITIIYSEPLGVFRFLLECQGFYHLTSRIRMLSLVLKVMLTLSLVYLSFNPALILVPLILETLLIAFSCLIFTRRLDAKLELKLQNFNFGIVKSFFKEGVKLWFGLICMSLFLKLDRLMLAERIAIEEFGLYSAAFSVLEQLTSLSAMILAVLAPVLIYRVSGRQLQKNTLKLAFVMFSLGFVGATVMYYLSEYFILAVYGNDYAESVHMFRVMVFIIPLVFFDSTINAYIIKNKSAFYFFLKWIVVLLFSYAVFIHGYASKGWLAGVYSYFGGFILASSMSVLYVAFYKSKANVSYA